MRRTRSQLGGEVGELGSLPTLGSLMSGARVVTAIPGVTQKGNREPNPRYCSTAGTMEESAWFREE